MIKIRRNVLLEFRELFMRPFEGYKHYDCEFLVLQPRDKAAMLGVNTIKFFLEEFA